MSFPPFGSPLSAAALEVVSRCGFFLDVAAMEETSDGLLRAESGHLGVFSRGATLAGVLDNNAVSYTAVDAQVAYESRLDASGAMRAGIRMGPSDRLVFADPPPISELSGYLEMVETGARVGTAGATLFAICNDAVSGARLWLDTSGTYYRINWSDGTITRTATLTVGQPTSGQRVRLRWTLSATGVVTLWQSINDAAETTATAAALALTTAWGSEARVRLNARGDTENPAAGACFHVVKIVNGTPPLATLLAIR
jgi:hypothetical protein